MALAPSVHNPAGNEGQAPTNMNSSAAGQAAAQGRPGPDWSTPTGGGGGGGGTTVITLAPEDTHLPGGIDYSGILGIAGLPQDLINQINDLFTKFFNVSDATAAALALVRGSAWYAQTFPGIGEGIKKGLLTDERSYRAYVSSLSLVYRQYTGRDVSSSEVVSALSEGVAPDLVGRRFQGQAYADAHAPELQFLSGAFGDDGRLSAADLTSYGQEQAGIDTPTGQRIQAALGRAMTRYQTLFTGTLATPSLSLGKQGLSAPSLLGTQQTPDVAA